MLKNTIIKKNNKYFYGYIIIVAVWIIYFSNVGLILYGTSVLNANMIAVKGFNKVTIGIAVSLCTAMQGITGPLVGYLIKIKGLKLPIILGSGILTIGSFFIAKFINSEIMFIFLYGIIIGFGMGTAGILTSQSAVNQWFDKRKPMSMAVVLSAGGIGGFVAPIIFNSIITSFSWVEGWSFISAMCFISLILGLTVIVNRPEDIGEVPDGKKYHDLLSKGSGIKSKPKEKSLKLSEILKLSSFYVILTNYITKNILYYSCIGHLVIYLIEEGFTSSSAAFSISMITIMSLIGRFIAGAICTSNFKNKIVLSTANMLMALGLIAICFSRSIYIIYLDASVIGLGLGLSYVALPISISSVYGSENFAVVNGAIYPANYIFAALGPAIAGIVSNATGSYIATFIAFSILTIFGGLIVLYDKK